MKKLIISLICLVAAIVLIFVFIIPFWDGSGLLKVSLANKEAELKRLEERIEKVDYLKNEYLNMESEIQKVFLALPREEDIPNLLVQFEALASSNGLILDSISFGQLQQKQEKQNSVNQVAAAGEDDDSVAPTQSGQTKETQSGSFLRNLNVEVSLSGRYGDFKRYLDSLANNIRSMSVQSISFDLPQSRSSDQGDSQTDAFVSNLSVNVHYQ